MSTARTRGRHFDRDPPGTERPRFCGDWPTGLDAGPFEMTFSDQQRQIDQFCDAFEMAHLQGEFPRLSNFLHCVSDTLREEMIYELICVDIHYLRQKRVRPSLTRYVKELGGYRNVIQRAMHDCELETPPEPHPPPSELLSVPGFSKTELLATGSCDRTYAAVCDSTGEPVQIVVRDLPACFWKPFHTHCHAIRQSPIRIAGDAISAMLIAAETFFDVAGQPSAMTIHRHLPQTTPLTEHGDHFEGHLDRIQPLIETLGGQIADLHRGGICLGEFGERQVRVDPEFRPTLLDLGTGIHSDYRPANPSDDIAGLASLFLTLFTGNREVDWLRDSYVIEFGPVGVITLCQTCLRSGLESSARTMNEFLARFSAAADRDRAEQNTFAARVPRPFVLHAR